MSAGGRAWPSVGLLGRVLAVLLAALLVEFAASTVLYERATRVSLRKDEAQRLAEHLVVARKLVTQGQPLDRPSIASRLATTIHYDVRWSVLRNAPPLHVAALDQMRAQVIAWEPELRDSGLRLWPGPDGAVAGALRLADGSWLRFAMHGGSRRLLMAADRVLVALISTLALLVVGGLVIRHTLRPMARLASAARRMGLGQTTSVQEEGPGEVRRVIRAFNDMQHRIHRLIADRTQALAAVGHDLRTPLARMQLRLDDVPDGEGREAMSADIAEMAAMVSSLLAYLSGEDDPEEPVRIDLAVMAATMVDDAVDRGRDAEYVGPEHLEMRVRPVGIKRALSNLVENALHYGSRVTLRLEAYAEEVILRVEDDGPGIPPDKLVLVLQPFARLDEARSRNTNGLGLGLSIVAQAAEREGGALHLSNRAAGGLVAELVLYRR